jgi:anti-sigma B factor antagonist
MTRDLEINIVRNGACSVVHVSGDIDLKSSPELRSAVLELFEKRGQERVILDLAGVHYLDSSGIASLVEGLQQAKKRNARFILCNLNEAPRHVLELTRLSKVFEITGTVEEALR